MNCLSQALYSEFVAKVYRGEALGPDVSMLKVHQTELYQRITETMLEIAAEYGGHFGPLDGNRELNPAGLFIQSRPSTIYAGSNDKSVAVVDLASGALLQKFQLSDEV